jgi:hypothetical protein
VAPYAAGVLTGPSEDVVRRHLAGGCRECLDALFAAPVGVARGRATPLPIGRRETLSVVSAVLVVIALMGTVLASALWLAGGRRTLVASDHRGAVLGTIEADAAGVQERLAALGSRAAALEANLGSLEPGAGDAPSAERTRSSSRPRRSATERALAQLGAALSERGVRIDRLHAVSALGGMRGWVVWDGVRGRLFVYAAGLPRLAAPWEARVAIGDVEHRLALRRLGDGSLWGVLRRTGAVTCAMHVSIVPPSADRVVLAGDLATCQADPAA